MSFTNAQTAFAQAATAFRAKDYTTAIDRLLEAQSYMAAIPDSARTGDTLTFGRELTSLLAAARERERTAGLRQAGGIQTTKVQYVRASRSGSDCE